MGEILDLAGCTPAEKIDSAQNRFIRAVTALRDSPPIVIVGDPEYRELKRAGDILVESLTGGEIPPSSYSRSIGLVVYYAARNGNVWEARCCSGLPGCRFKRLGTVSFKTAEEAWTACEIWYRVDQKSAMHATHFAAIQEVPYFYLEKLKQNVASEIEPFLTEEDFRAAEDAWILFECRWKPALAKLCCKLGAAAALDPKDPRLVRARVLDSTLNTGKVDRQVWRRHRKLGQRIKKLLRQCRRFRNSAKRQLQKLVDTDLVRHWISSGYIFLSKCELARIINLKHGANYTPDNIARECRSLGLKSKRANARPEELRDRTLAMYLKWAEDIVTNSCAAAPN